MESALYLIPLTEKAWKVSDRLDELEGGKGQEPRHIGHRLMDYSVATWLCLIMFDQAITNILGNGFSTLYFISLAIVAAAAVVGFGITVVISVRDHALPSMYKALCENGGVAEVHYKIIRRWAKVRRSVGIDRDEPRSDLEEFPEVIRQAVELQKAILSDVPQATKQRLAQRMIQIMREALEPLALDLRVSAVFGSLGHEMEADAEQQLAVQRLASRRVADELKAEHLLRTI
jgi:hypothetical protein